MKYYQLAFLLLRTFKAELKQKVNNNYPIGIFLFGTFALACDLATRFLQE